MAKQPVTVRLYRFQNRLKERCAGLSTGDVSISPEAIAAAEGMLEKMAEDYPDWVSALLLTLQEKHSRCVDTPEDRKELFIEINSIAHDMKGQGGTFGYPLMTQFADSLYTITDGRGKYTDNQVELVKSHLDAMRAVIKARLKGDGGAIGKELSETLEKALAKYTKAEEEED